MAFVPFDVDPQRFIAGEAGAVRRVAANLAYAGARAGAVGLKRKFFQLAMSQGDNVAHAALVQIADAASEPVAKMARTVGENIGVLSRGDRPRMTPKTRMLFGRIRSGIRGRVTRASRRRPYRRSRVYPARRSSYKRRRTSRYSRRRYY